MHSLLYLLAVFFATVLTYFAGGSEFVGFVFLIVYVGAVAILFLFVIMLFSVKSLTEHAPALFRHGSQVLGLTSAAALFYATYAQIFPALVRALAAAYDAFASVERHTVEAILLCVRFSMDIKSLFDLYDPHGILFLIVTNILLSALLGAIILATATTERATKTTDIRYYAPRTLVVTPQFATAIITLCVTTHLPPELLADVGGVALMSAYN